MKTKKETVSLFLSPSYVGMYLLIVDSYLIGANKSVIAIIFFTVIGLAFFILGTALLIEELNK